MIDTIMLFAAGLGNRMRHLTENSPKTLLSILGKPILHHALKLCRSYPFKKIVINTHYLSKQVEKSVEDFKEENPGMQQIVIVYEEELLETGGAIKNAHNILGDEPIFTLNTDIILRAEYNIFEFIGYSGHGDFDLDQEGKLVRPDKQENYGYMYSGLQILKPRKVAKHPLRIFSLREYYLNSNKVIGLPAHDARWYHTTRPEDIIDIEMDMLAHETT